MPLSIVEWPQTLAGLVQDIEVIPGPDGKSCCRLDVDVDNGTLFLLNDFEARARHRQVQIPLGDGSACIRGEMNPIVGLGSPSDLKRHTGKVRISFHDVVTDGCAEI